MLLRRQKSFRGAPVVTEWELVVRAQPKFKHRGAEYIKVQRGPRHEGAGQVTPVHCLESGAQSLWRMKLER